MLTYAPCQGSGRLPHSLCLLVQDCQTDHRTPLVRVMSWALVMEDVVEEVAEEREEEEEEEWFSKQNQ